MFLSASQIDRLGERLKSAAEAGRPISDGDRRLLLEVRSMFLPAYREVVSAVRGVLGVDPSGRPEKTPESIVAKLVRERTSLSRMHDIAGCRLVVPYRRHQDELTAHLVGLFSDHRIVDRRQSPRHGYRAIHLVVRAQGRPVEIQVRTYLQEMWAAYVELCGNLPGVDMKHGVVPDGMEALFGGVVRASEIIAALEEGELTRTRMLEDRSHAEVWLYQAGLFRGIMLLSAFVDDAHVPVLGV